MGAADVAPSVGEGRKEKKGSKGKKWGKEKRGGGEGGGGGGASSRRPQADAPATPSPKVAPSPAAGTAAGDGGRWVHVPN